MPQIGPKHTNDAIPPSNKQEKSDAHSSFPQRTTNTTPRAASSTSLQERSAIPVPHHPESNSIDGDEDYLAWAQENPDGSDDTDDKIPPLQTHSSMECLSNVHVTPTDIRPIINKALGHESVVDCQSDANLEASQTNSLNTGITEAVQNSTLTAAEFTQKLLAQTKQDSQERKIITSALGFLAGSGTFKGNNLIKQYATVIDRAIEVACKNPEISEYEPFLEQFTEKDSDKFTKKK